MKKETVIHIERSGPEPRYTTIPQQIMRPHQEIRVILIEETPELKPTEEEAAPEGYEVGAFPGEKPMFVGEPERMKVGEQDLITTKDGITYKWVPECKDTDGLTILKAESEQLYQKGIQGYFIEDLGGSWSPIKEDEGEHGKRIELLVKSCRETQNNVYQNIVNKSFTGGEPELNEDAISKLCDDLIEAKKKPLSAAQIIDKYARRD